jgi:hypothetical protein
MGYEVWTNKEVYICGETFNTKEQLQARIKECEETIADCLGRLKTLVFMTEPKKFYKDDTDVMWQVNRDFEEIMEEYDEARITLTRLWVFESAWDDTHDFNGRAILPVDPMKLKNLKTYMGGDYMNYVLEDGEEMPDDWWDVYHGFVKPEDCSFADKLGYPLKSREPERDMTIGELNALMKLELEKNGIEVNLDEL